jgi:dihydrofolate reductase
VGGPHQGLQVRRLGDAFDQVFGEEIDRVFKEKCDLLLGRKTYEIFAGYWPYCDETAPAGGIAKLFKDIKKYVVSRSGVVDTSWRRSVLLRHIADVKRLREEDGPNLVTQGSTELVNALLANDLVDAMSIFTVPVCSAVALRGRLRAAQLQADQVARLEPRPHDRALRARWRDQDRRHRVRFTERR